ncbi:MAG: hypothetical protein ABIG44_18930, partial [Planctomycetota bacterium]
MADEHEILKYQLDITDVESKAQRILELQQQIATARAAGEQTNELESQLNKEIESLGKLGEQEKKAVSTTDELTRSKDKLANTVTLVGGRFGGMIGQLGGVVELLASGGKAAIALAGALAGLAIGNKIFAGIEEAARKATEAQKALNEAILASQYGKYAEAAEIGEKLAGHGARTPENMQAAQQMAGRLGLTWGVAQGERTSVAALATAAGVGSPQDAAVLATMIRRGVQLDTPEKARDALNIARKEGVYDALLAEANRSAQDAASRHERVKAAAPGARTPAGMRPVHEAYDAMRATGRLPEDMTRSDFIEAGLGFPTLKEEITGDFGTSEYKRKVEERMRLADLQRQYSWVQGYVKQVEGIQAGAGPMSTSPTQPQGVP